MPTTEPILMSRKETMAMIGGVSYDTFRRLLADGSFPAGIQVGGRLRWNRTVVIEHINARTTMLTSQR
ncbi:MAG TPA: hypothetical protein PKE16_02090 [Hyphomicrobium sp.]|nr:hypothetical protein [Hyphomicrobium sp.]